MLYLYTIAVFFRFDLLLLSHIDSSLIQNVCNWNWKVATEITLLSNRILSLCAELYKNLVSSTVFVFMLWIVDSWRRHSGRTPASLWESCGTASMRNAFWLSPARLMYVFLPLFSSYSFTVLTLLFCQRVVSGLQNPSAAITKDFLLMDLWSSRLTWNNST